MRCTKSLRYVGYSGEGFPWIDKPTVGEPDFPTLYFIDLNREYRWDGTGWVAMATHAPYAAGNTGATPAINYANGDLQSWTVSANTTFAAPTNPPAIGKRLVVLLTSSGSFTLAWNATFRNAPSGLSATNGQKATFEFIYDGTNWQYAGGSTAFA